MSWDYFMVMNKQQKKNNQDTGYADKKTLTKGQYILSILCKFQ